jgi:predicted phosphodiesterase
MRIAILSDVHDHVWNLETILRGLPAADALLFCGDLCSPFVVDVLAQGFPGPIFTVEGNNRGDEAVVALKASGYGARYQRLGPFAELVELDGALQTRADYEGRHGPFADRQRGGQRFAVSHYPEVALAVAAAGRHDVVCYGHDHTFRIGCAGETLTINPGTVMGYCPSRPPDERDVPATFVVYDTTSREAAAYRVTPPAEGDAGGPGGPGSPRVVPHRENL